jgi:hypothetical protein
MLHAVRKYSRLYMKKLVTCAGHSASSAETMVKAGEPRSAAKREKDLIHFSGQPAESDCQLSEKGRGRAIG